MGRYLGFHATTARITDLSPQFVMAHQIFTDFSANRYGSVITTVQPLLWYFLRDLFSLRFPLVARDCVSITSQFLTTLGIFLQLTTVSDPGTT